MPLSLKTIGSAEVIGTNEIRGLDARRSIEAFRTRSAYRLYGKPENSGESQMEWFIPVEIFRKKKQYLLRYYLLPFLPKRPKFSVPFVWITSARLHLERKRKLYRYFVNGAAQSRSCFRYQRIQRASTI